MSKYTLVNCLPEEVEGTAALLLTDKEVTLVNTQLIQGKSSVLDTMLACPTDAKYKLPAREPTQDNNKARRVEERVVPLHDLRPLLQGIEPTIDDRLDKMLVVFRTLHGTPLMDAHVGTHTDTSACELSTTQRETL